MKPQWEQWEEEIQNRWGLSSTVCSGNQFHDPGDAVSRGTPYDHFRLMVDCKYTDKQSFSLRARTLKQWLTTGMSRGKISILAIRFSGKSDTPTDWVVLSLDDFEELWEKARRWAQEH